METILDRKKSCAVQPDHDIEIRLAKGGDPSRICVFYDRIFTYQYHFLPCWEGYFIQSLGEYFYNPEENRIWIAEKNNRIVGCIGVVYRSDCSAQLRWFGVEESLQGSGIGSALFCQCLKYCKEKGYSRLYLWTVDLLKPARHLYAKNGFILTDTKPNNEWAAYPITEEEWQYLDS